MDGLSVAASVAGVISLGIQVATSLVEFYSACKSQTSDVAYTVKKLEHLLSVLETLRSELTARKFRADEQDVLKTIEDSIQACEDCIDELQNEIAKFETRSAGGIRAAARTAAYRVAYPLRQSTLQKLDENIEETLSHLSLVLQVLHQKDIGRVQDDIENTKAVLDLVRADQISAEIRSWLKAPDAAINYNEACKKRHPGTGLWFVNGISFSAWLLKPNSFLWLNGIAGCGKSVLCSTAIQFAFRHRRSNPRIGIAFFFFTFSDISKQDTSSMLRALVLQLSCQLNDNHRLLAQFHHRYLHKTPPQDHALLDCLHQLVRAFDDVYILLDALDESPRDKNRADVMQALAYLRAWSEPSLHLLITSRDEPDVRKELVVADDQEIPMRNTSVDADIAAFVFGQLRQKRQLRKWEEHHTRIGAALAERAKGVFRWVECQLKALESCPQCEDLLDRLLESLPQSLDETYERMLSNITPTSAEYARRILTLLCCAKRPLTVPELIDGIAVELGEFPKFNPRRRLKTAVAIHQVCPGFIEVDVDPQNNESTVRIVHFSVQEYLESERIREHTAAFFGVQRPKAHTELACTCLTYLLQPTLSASSDPTAEFPLARYAADNWHNHYHDGDKALYPVQLQALQLFKGSGGVLENWVRVWLRGTREQKGPFPVYYASFLGLDFVISELLCEDRSGGAFHGVNTSYISDLVNIRCGRYGNALQAASSEGHETVVRLLLDRGANINATGGYFGNALQAASFGGHETVVRLLLDRGANINATGGFRGTALKAASSEGHEAVVRLLIDRGANINVSATDGYGGTALKAASYEGHETVVRLLLDRGANINATGGGTALQNASFRGHETVVRLLLDRGANINATDGLNKNALQAASLGGDEAVVRLLLDRGANVNMLGGRYESALQAASSQGHEAVVRLLIDRGANINATGGYFGNALQAASSKGCETIVRLLLDRGANTNTIGGYFESALQAASSGGHEDVVRLLLDRGANLYPPGDVYGNALEAASSGGHEAVVRLLLDRVAHINTLSLGDIRDNALRVASFGGHDAIVRLLLDRGANISPPGRVRENALEAASRGGHETVVRLLLDKGVNIDASDDIYKEALKKASRSGHKAIVQLLLDKAASIDGGGSTP